MKKIKREYMLTIISGIVLIFLGILLQVLELVQGVIPLVFMNSGFILIVISLIAHNRYGGKVTQDERTRAIGARALSYSWLLTFILINVLFWIDYTKIVELSANHILGIILFTMVLSGSIIQFFLKRRGAVDEN